MSKVFRLHNTGSTSITDWTNVSKYGNTIIDEINDPTGGKIKLAPTSIPSPFARMDIVRTSFYNVANGDQDENTIFNKIVSDTLDLMEMIFNIDFYEDDIKVIKWEKEKQLEILKKSSNEGHRLLGETLELFFTQDREAYNFSKVKNLFLFEYKHNIVGGTSPLTIFYTSANNLAHLKIKKTKGDTFYFSDKLTPLYGRDADFQRYLYLFFQENRQLKGEMESVFRYLEQSLKSLEKINEVLFREFKEILRDSYSPIDSNLDYLPLGLGLEGYQLEICESPLYKKKIQNIVDTIAKESDFKIKSKKLNEQDTFPLLLQNNFNKKLVYLDKTTIWDANTNVPYGVNQVIEERCLPGTTILYPYLTVNDFLLPYIIELPYPINTYDYFDGNLASSYMDGISLFYALPLSELFFTYFSVNEILQNPELGGLSMIEMKRLPNSVTVKLRIPIASGDYITFEKEYQKGTKDDRATIIDRKGYIKKRAVTLSIAPFIRFESNIKPIYKLLTLDSELSLFDHVKFTCFNSDRNIPIDIIKTNISDKESDQVFCTYNHIESLFDAIILSSSQGDRGVIIPKFKKIEKQGNVNYEFAIDFGTTNTHIEYKKQNEACSKKLDITTLDRQNISLLGQISVQERGKYNIPDSIWTRFLTLAWMPDLMEGNSISKFPTRTVLQLKNKSDFELNFYSLVNGIVDFYYQKYDMDISAYRQTETNLKWSNKGNNQDMIKLFFDELFFLIRNKILLNNGNLENTKIVWFYPSSMPKGRIVKLENLWTKVFINTINSDTKKLIRVPESIAPYYYYQKVGDIRGMSTNVATIDIGGGTTDIAIYQKEQPQLITSIRFAANNVFGNGLNGSIKDNGFVKFIEPIIQKYKDSHNDVVGEIFKPLYQFQANNDAIEYCNYLLSLNGDTRFSFDFVKALRENEGLNFVILTSFGAIIYHLAKLMKLKSLKVPSSIIFSGNGSKVLNVIDVGTINNSSILSFFVKKMFSAVNSDNDNKNISIRSDDHPKELTCKGGLLVSEESQNIENKMGIVLIGDTENTIVPDKSLKYENITEQLTDSIIDEVIHFFDLLFSLNSDSFYAEYFDFKNNLLVEMKNTLCDREALLNDLLIGIKQLEKENLDSDGNIETSLFFIPITGAIYRLANSVSL